VLAADDIVVVTVAGRRVDGAGAGVERDVVARDDDGIAFDPRMARGEPFELAPLEGRQRGADREPLRERGDEVGRDDERALGRLDERVREVGADRDREVGRKRPRGRRPDRDERAAVGERSERSFRFDRERHEDRRRLLGVVVDFGFGQRRAARGAPVHGLPAAEDAAGLEDRRELARFLRLEGKILREVGTLPLTEHAETFEVLALYADELVRIFAAEPADLDEAHLGLRLAADLLLDLELDRQAVRVPARPVRRAEAGHRLVLDDDVLEDLVERVADVDGAVGVRRPVVEQEQRRTLAAREHALVEVFALPDRQHAGLALGQVGPHREVRRRKLEGLFVVFAVHRSRRESA
jgi:hypothetical protein